MKRHCRFMSFATIILATIIALCFPEVVCAQVAQPEAAASQGEWSADQLDNLVAPIALYPDPLLSQMLVASTYPLEVVEAHQWLQRNQQLSGQALVDAARQQPWDPSVQALVATPDALDFLNQDIRWTTDLGDAFLAQQTDVMSAVQRMRARAQGDGRLYSTPQQTVTTETQGSRQVIVIEPASPDIVYVPVYDPFYVWGPPAFGYYPALYYPTFGFSFGIGYNLSLCFGGWGGWGFWGWTPNWFGGTVFLNNGFFSNYGFHQQLRGNIHGRTVWTHNSEHRLGIPYGNRHVAKRFQGNGISPYTNRNRSRYSGGERGTAPGTRPQAYQYRNPGRSSTPPQYRQRTPRQESRSPRGRFESRAQPGYRSPQRYSIGRESGRSPRIFSFRNPAPSGNRAPRASRAPGLSSRQLSGTFNRGNAGSFSRPAGHSISPGSGRASARSGGSRHR